MTILHFKRAQCENEATVIEAILQHKEKYDIAVERVNREFRTLQTVTLARLCVIKHEILDEADYIFRYLKSDKTAEQFWAYK